MFYGTFFLLGIPASSARFVSCLPDHKTWTFFLDNHAVVVSGCPPVLLHYFCCYCHPLAVGAATLDHKSKEEDCAQCAGAIAAGGEGLRRQQTKGDACVKRRIRSDSVWGFNLGQSQKLRFFCGLQRIKQIGRNKRWQSPVLILTKFTNDTAVNGHWETDKLGLTRTGGAEPIWSEPSLCAKEGVVHLWTRRLDLPCAKALYWQRCRQSVVG